MSMTLLLTAILLATIPVRTRAEPECSRFHYEEKTLEKMIRQEIRMEQMELSVSKTKVQIESALRDIQEDRQAFRREMEEIKKTRTEEKEKYLQEWEEIKGTMVLPHVAFHAKSLKNTKPASGETLVFQDTIFDHGNVYNNQTGLFTASDAGIYYFNMHLCIKAAKAYTYIEAFTSDGSILKSRIVSSDPYWTCQSTAFLVVLHRQETFGVKMTSTSVSAGEVVLWDDKSYVECSFSGFLVSLA